MEKKVIVIGGGWSGIAAAVAAKKCGADVTIVEKTDLHAGLGKRGRHHAQQRKIYCGGGKYRSGGFGALRAHR